MGFHEANIPSTPFFEAEGRNEEPPLLHCGTNTRLRNSKACGTNMRLKFEGMRYQHTSAIAWHVVPETGATPGLSSF